MPNNIVVSFSDKTGKSVDEVEALWDKAVEITQDTFGSNKKNFGNKEYKYTVGVLKNMLNIKENKKSIMKLFLENKDTVDSFIENVISGSFPMPDQVIPPINDDEEEEFWEERSMSRITEEDMIGDDEDDPATHDIDLDDIVSDRSPNDPLPANEVRDNVGEIQEDIKGGEIQGDDEDDPATKNIDLDYIVRAKENVNRIKESIDVSALDSMLDTLD
jgi:hypothetical protein